MPFFACCNLEIKTLRLACKLHPHTTGCIRCSAIRADEFDIVSGVLLDLMQKVLDLGSFPSIILDRHNFIRFFFNDQFMMRTYGLPLMPSPKLEPAP
jgi:hypothetical protein